MINEKNNRQKRWLSSKSIVAFVLALAMMFGGMGFGIAEPMKVYAAAPVASGIKNMYIWHSQYIKIPVNGISDEDNDIATVTLYKPKNNKDYNKISNLEFTVEESKSVYYEGVFNSKKIPNGEKYSMRAKVTDREGRITISDNIFVITIMNPVTDEIIKLWNQDVTETEIKDSVKIMSGNNI